MESEVTVINHYAFRELKIFKFENLMIKLILLYFYFILCRYFTFALNITAVNVNNYFIKEDQKGDSAKIQFITGNGQTATIADNAFQKLIFKPNKNGLTVNRFKISILPERLFDTNTWFSEGLISLTLQLNIESLPEKIFHSLREIVAVLLNSNPLTVLHPNLFKNNLNLQFVSFVRCKMKTLPIGLFLNNPKLTRVDLSENQLVKIRRGVFYESNLKRVSIVLNRNYIVCLPHVLLSLMKTNLKLSNNILKKSSKFCKKFKCKGLTMIDRDCLPEADQISECNDIDNVPPKVDGNFTQWSNWSPCSKKGVKTGHRECTNPMPNFGGENCTGPIVKSLACHNTNDIGQYSNERPTIGKILIQTIAILTPFLAVFGLIILACWMLPKMKKKLAEKFKTSE